MRSTVLTPPIRVASVALFAAIAASFGFNSSLSAQQQRQRMAEETLSIPPSEQLLEISVDAPREARVGQSYDMQVVVRNASSALTLHDIELEASTSGPIEIQSSQMGQAGQTSSQQNDRSGQNAGSGGSQDQSSNQQNQQNQDQQNQNQNQQSATQQSQNQQSGSQNAASQNSSGNQGSKKSWTIKELKPGQTKQIVLTAVGDEQQKGSVCLSVVSYRRSVCIDTQLTKPELSLAKQAPDEAPLCEVVPIVYTVENTGTGDLGPFTIEDSLSEGLRTESGDQKLKFEVSGLDAGETRKFRAEVVPVQRGEFSSRAVAKAQNSDLEQQSKNVTTKVVGPELAVAIDGPNTAYVDRPIDYTVRITNTGNMALDSGMLAMTFPSSAEISQQGDFQQTDNQVSSGSQDGTQGQPQEAQSEQGSSQSQQGSSSGSGSNSNSNQAQSSQQDVDQRQYEFNRLEPGETIMTTFVLRGVDSEKVDMKAKASFECAVGESEAKTSSVAHTQTQIAQLAALLLTVVDERDPVRVGNEVVYTINVRNQGNSPDENLQITAQLPQKLKFKEASGATSAESDGRKVTFDKVDKITPGEELKWTLRAVGESSGTTQLAVTLQSDGLDQKVQSEEPTQLFGGNSGQSSSQSPDQQNSNQQQNSNSNTSNQSNASDSQVSDESDQTGSQSSESADTQSRSEQ